MEPRNTIREDARRLGTDAGRRSAAARGLDDWDAEALDAAVEAERRYLEAHGLTFNPERTV